MKGRCNVCDMSSCVVLAEQVHALSSLSSLLVKEFVAGQDKRVRATKELDRLI